MILVINGRTYDATPMSVAESITIVHKTTEQMRIAYEDFRSAESFKLGEIEYTKRLFAGMNAHDSGENIQATYATKDVSGIDREMEDKANGYDILTGGIQHGTVQ